MGINITEINLKNFGPLGDQDLKFKKLNLFYGPNESGKTFLTEFILQSIFKYPINAKWQMRDLPGQGKLYLSGLEPELTEFSPVSKRKIENYWEDSAPGLPTNMARLLFVKGGELALISGDESNKHFIKSILSQEALIERILKKIKPTIRGAEIVDEDILGANRGEIKNRNKLKNDLQKIDSLIKDIEKKLSWGQLYEKKQQLETLKNKIEIQEDAKKYYAFTLDDKIKVFENKLLPDENMENLHDDLREFKGIVSEIDGLKNKFEREKDVIDNFSWLDQAVRTWESLGLESVKRPKKVLRIAALAMLLLGALGITIQFVLALVTQNNGLSLVFFAFSLVFILLGFGLTVFYLRKIDGWEKAVLNSEERNAIISEYTDRFQNSIRGLTDLKAHLESIREENIKVKAIPGLLNEEEKSKQALILKIDRKMSEFGLNGVSQEDWENCLQEIKQSQSDIKSNIEKNKIDLARLNIQEEDYLVNPVEEEFNHDKLSKLSNKRKLTLEKVAEIEKGLEKLKASVCQETGDQLNTGWVEVLDKIQLKRERLLEDYKNTTAKIVGEIATKEVLLKLQKEEDEKIRKGIQTKELKNILSRITENYEAIDFNGDEVIVKGKYGDFSLSNISTGTREQILLALRMGFASKLAGGNPLFLILDDAFQHSDWNRREHLFDAVFRLVETGWQITYLTMSDHIRDRMKELGDERLGSEFRFHTLAQ